MKPLIFLLLVSLAFSYAATNKYLMNSDTLNGTWIPIKQEFAGSILPAEAFKKQKLIISDSNYTVIAESVDKGIVKYKNDKIDIYGTEGPNEGKHFSAIYKFENLPAEQELTICYNLAGDSYPETFETKDKPMYFLSVFKKETTK